MAQSNHLKKSLVILQTIQNLKKKRLSAEEITLKFWDIQWFSITKINFQKTFSQREIAHLIWVKINYKKDGNQEKSSPSQCFLLSYSNKVAKEGNFKHLRKESDFKRNFKYNSKMNIGSIRVRKKGK